MDSNPQKNWEVLPQQKDLKKIPEEKSGRYLPIGVHGIRKNLPSNLPMKIFYHHGFVTIFSFAGITLVRRCSFLSSWRCKGAKRCLWQKNPSKIHVEKKFSGFGFWIRKKTSKLTKNSQRVVLDAKNTQIQENGCFFNVFFVNLHATGAYIYIKWLKSVASSLIKCCRPKQLEELRRASKFESKQI